MTCVACKKSSPTNNYHWVLAKCALAPWEECQGFGFKVRQFIFELTEFFVHPHLS